MWAVIILLSSLAGGAAVAYCFVLETVGSKLKKDNLTLYNEIDQIKDNPDQIKTKVEEVENLKKTAEDELKKLEQKIQNEEVSAEDEDTKKNLQTHKDNITKHETELNYLKAVQSRGLNGIDYSWSNILWSGGTFLLSALIIHLILRQFLKIFKPNKDE